ncbi:hypothetical protein GXP67_02495 [Rhodocytophaga rosea]|uniref:Uncharacterized protein n=1 Tax=Rhodocytophaga rosea TaxID=2704465 RepID=A0A6C0GCC4_9BACT|nr:hypothetical protein [Rhodocytophaga rosea]QHT65611.1 hypothetical protein GXP67_02495 [Rhodocytophaga rosea]
MRQAASFPLKKILASDQQSLINFKLRYNALVDKINTSQLSDVEKQLLFEQLEQIDFQIAEKSNQEHT